MKKIELDIVALSHSLTQSHNYAVVLGEQDGKRRLPIVIGGFEAQAIAVAMERMAPSRPLTHDLMKNVLQIYDVELKEIIINNLLDGIFYARLVCLKDGDLIEIDSRTSDALAMAVRFDCPIYTYEFILESAGIIMDENEEEQVSEEGQEKKKPSRRKRQEPTSIKSMSVEDLENLLSEVLAKEDYEQAASIRDEINLRENEQ
jgi:bifunctional DNase/RNase